MTDDQAKWREAIEPILEGIASEYSGGNYYGLATPLTIDEALQLFDTYLAAERERVEVEAGIKELEGILYHLSITGDWNPQTIRKRLAELKQRKQPNKE